MRKYYYIGGAVLLAVGVYFFLKRRKEKLTEKYRAIYNWYYSSYYQAIEALNENPEEAANTGNPPVRRGYRLIKKYYEKAEPNRAANLDEDVKSETNWNIRNSEGISKGMVKDIAKKVGTKQLPDLKDEAVEYIKDKIDE